MGGTFMVVFDKEMFHARTLNSKSRLIVRTSWNRVAYKGNEIMNMSKSGINMEEK